MKIVDTNYLLRYILHDDESMFQKACQAIEAGASTRLESIPEVIYVLSRSFGVSRVDIANALMDLLDDVAIAQKELVLDALSLFSRTKLDYVDCIYIAESNARNERVLTFDKKMISKMKQLGIPE